MRRNPTTAQRDRLMAANGQMCCVCKAFGVGLEFHHIDGDPSNTVDENLAVLCVSDHDAHHRPSKYPILHIELGSTAIRHHKQQWETFIREAQLPKPRLLATVSAYGTLQHIHSLKVVYQWTTGTIVFERLYHQHSGNLDDWTTDLVDECARIGKQVPLALLNQPLDVKLCPCCHKSVDNVIDRGYGLRLVAPNWDKDSLGTIYINPDRPSLAVCFALERRDIFAGQLHLCRGRYLHFHCDDYDERRPLKRRPSVRTQATQLIENLLRDWDPRHLLIGTGDHHHPDLTASFQLPNCWESSARRGRCMIKFSSFLASFSVGRGRKQKRAFVTPSS